MQDNCRREISLTPRTRPFTEYLYRSGIAGMSKEFPSPRQKLATSVRVRLDKAGAACSKNLLKYSGSALAAADS
jgi:hypothetical protein